MRSTVLSAAAAGLGALALLQAAQVFPLGDQMRAFAATPALMDGCSDVPEAVALADTLRERGAAVDRGLQALEDRKREIAAAEDQLKARLTQLRAAKDALDRGEASVKTGADQGITRLIAVYDAMKPAEAAEVLAALPPDFGAEILARVQPETGARIIAALEPTQAAILTARLGAARISKD